MIGRVWRCCRTWWPRPPRARTSFSWRRARTCRRWGAWQCHRVCLLYFKCTWSNQYKLHDFWYISFDDESIFKLVCRLRLRIKIKIKNLNWQEQSLLLIYTFFLSQKWNVKIHAPFYCLEHPEANLWLISHLHLLHISAVQQLAPHWLFSSSAS